MRTAFLRATALYATARIAIARPSVRPSVRLSHGWVQKGLMLGL